MSRAAMRVSMATAVASSSSSLPLHALRSPLRCGTRGAKTDSTRTRIDGHDDSAAGNTSSPEKTASFSVPPASPLRRRHEAAPDPSSATRSARGDVVKDVRGHAGAPRQHLSSALLRKQAITTRSKPFDISDLFNSRLPAGKAKASASAAAAATASPSSSSKPPQERAAAPVADRHKTHHASLPPPPATSDRARRGEKTPRASSSTSPLDTPSSSAVSAAFLARLSRTVAAKRLDWAAATAAHPELRRLPILREREHWLTHDLRRNSAEPLGGDDGGDGDDDGRTSATAPAVLLCAADTGTGKSLLVPLFLLEAHWLTLTEKLHRASAVGSVAGAGQPPSPLPLGSLKAFASGFKACSRVCIAVSQPTRVACVEMARYAATLLSAADGSRSAESEDSFSPRAKTALLGKRVGYAVGGEACFCAETEIVYTTPGYLLNALQHQSAAARGPGTRRPTTTPSAAGALRPTTVVIDEAHCRELETDLLLSWVKTQTGMASSARTRSTASAAATAPPFVYPLRHVVVMSATMNVPAMLHYLQTDSYVRKGDGAGEAPDVRILTFASQRARLAKHASLSAAAPSVARLLAWEQQEAWQLASFTPPALQRVCDSRHSSSPTSDTTTPPSPASLHNNPNHNPFTVEEYFVGDLSNRFIESTVLFRPWVRDGVFVRGSAREEAGRAAPRRRALTRSDGTAALVASATEAAAWGRPFASNAAAVPALLTADGQWVLNSLQHFYSLHGIRHSVFHMSQANVVADFLLKLLQAVRLRWLVGSGGGDDDKDGGHEGGSAGSSSREPPTVLLFLPGFGEIQLVLQCLEKMCARVTLPRPDAASAGANGEATFGEPVTILQFGEDVFSVPVLHAAAVGSPHEHLAASAVCGAPLRLVLATAVAESSLTIPNVKVVVDSALERLFRADPVTGTMTKLTAIVDAGSLRQRRGRAGRTCDGVVIHLAPRELFLSPPQQQQQHRDAVRPQRSTAAVAVAVGESDAATAEEEEARAAPHGDAVTPSSTSSAAHLWMAPLRESATSVLLRVKALFPIGPAASVVLSRLPAPPNAAAVETAYRLLLDMELLAPPPSTPPAAAAATEWGGPSRLYAGELAGRLDRSTLTRKGRVVAALPIPLEPSLLVCHAFQFACVEDAVVLACAMTVPSITLSPRLSPSTSAQGAGGSGGASSSRNGASHGSSNSNSNSNSSGNGASAAFVSGTFSPLEQFYKHIWVQRHLAGFPVPTSTGVDEQRGQPLTEAEGTPHGGEGGDNHNDADRRSGSRHLSEPLVLRALMRRWYACVTQEDIHRFLAELSINRSALRSVDVSVAQCCQRLLQLLNREEQEVAEEEAGAADGARSTSSPSPSWEGAAEGEDACPSGSRSSNEADSPDYYTFHHLLQEREGEAAAADEPPKSEKSGGAKRTTLLASTSPNRRVPPQHRLVDPRWPRSYRRRLVHSLQRLRQAALARAVQRQGAASRGVSMPQWFGMEAELERVFEQHYLSPRLYKHEPGGTARASGTSPTPAACSTSASARHPMVEEMIQRAQAEGQRASDSSGTARHATTSKAWMQGRREAQRRVLADGHLTFTLGRLEDRLCAAFVAAFARQTLRGEDGGHRRHHRRLTRNWSVMQDDTDHTCTFGIDCRPPPSAASLAAPSRGVRGNDGSGGVADGAGGGGGVGVGEGVPRVTPEAVRRALTPFLRGTGLAQVEVFASGRPTAAVRFASMGFQGLMLPSSPSSPSTAVKEPVGAAEAGDARGKERDGQAAARLQPQVVLYERDIVSREDCSGGSAGEEEAATHHTRTDTVKERRWFSDGNPLVRLAPFGVSLVIAAQSALQRIAIDGDVVPPHEAPSTSPPLSDTLASTRQSPTLLLSAAPPDEALTTVSWTERSGALCRLQRADVAALGLSHLLPPPPPSSLLARVGPPPMEARDRATQTAAPSAPPPSSSAHPSLPSPFPTSAQRPLLLSVLSPINVTGGVYWRVGLPSVAALWLERQHGDHGAIPAVSVPAAAAAAAAAAVKRGRDGDEDAGMPSPHQWSAPALPPLRVAGRAVQFCEVCHCLLIGADAVATHCHSPVHLSRLLFAVRHGIRRDDWLRLRGALPRGATASSPHARSASPKAATACGVDLVASLLLHSGSSSRPGDASETRAMGTAPPLTMEDHSCRVSALSFLNALQWDMQHSRDPPLAVAGRLLSTPSQATVLPPHAAALLRGRSTAATSANTSITAASAATDAAARGVRDVQDPMAGVDDVFYHRYAAAAAGLGTRAASSGAVVTAQYVWLLNLSLPPAEPYHQRHSLPTALLVLAGYLAGSSRQYPTAFLFNARHTHIHGIMLAGCGVWRLPAPLPVRQLLPALARVRDGGGWPGVVTCSPPPSASSAGGSTDGEETPSAGEETGMCDGLHWCLADAVCPGHTFETLPEPCPAPPRSADTEGRRERDAAVAAAILLTLHEFVAAQRNMVAYADFVERLIAKLDPATRPPPPSAAAAVCTRKEPAEDDEEAREGRQAGNRGVQSLCDFLDHRSRGARRETLLDVLRDVGCQFSAPPVAAVGLLYDLSPSPSSQAHRREADVEEEGAKGGSMVIDTRFTVPPVLPSRLPAAGFGVMLRRSMRVMGRDGWGVDANPTEAFRSASVEF